MPKRADAHIHLFRPGYVGTYPETCRRIEPSEVTLYDVLRQKHGIAKALIVGYEGGDWAAGNNAYLQELAPHHDWIAPVAFFHDPRQLSIAHLERLRGGRFVGISLYLHTDSEVARLQSVDSAIWRWFVEHRWLISVNSQGEQWRPWREIVQEHPELRVLVSHLGLPPAQREAPNRDEARNALDSVRTLAPFPGVHVKLSGFYALTTPEHDYPHVAAWPYVEVLLEDFGPTRLLWGSDYSPSLERLSFPQTLGLFAKMPFLSIQDRDQIEGGNLLTLLSAAMTQDV